MKYTVEYGAHCWIATIQEEWLENLLNHLESRVVGKKKLENGEWEVYYF